MKQHELDTRLQQTLSRGRTTWTRPRGCPDIELCLFDPDCLEYP